MNCIFHHLLYLILFNCRRTEDPSLMVMNLISFKIKRMIVKKCSSPNLQLTVCRISQVFLVLTLRIEIGNFASAFDWLKSFDFKKNDHQSTANLSSDDSDEENFKEETWLILNDSDDEDHILDNTLNNSSQYMGSEAKKGWRSGNTPSKIKNLKSEPTLQKTEGVMRIRRHSVKHPSGSYLDQSSLVVVDNMKYIESLHKGKKKTALFSLSLDTLIDKITQKHHDRELYSEFLVALPFITNVASILDKLESKYFEVHEKGESVKDFEKRKLIIQKKIVNVLKDWIGKCFYCFFSLPNFLRLVRLLNKLVDTNTESESSESKKIKQPPRDMLLRIVQYQLARIDFTELDKLVYVMKNEINCTKVSLTIFNPGGDNIQERDSFSGEEAVTWLKHRYESSISQMKITLNEQERKDFDCVLKSFTFEPKELMNHLLRDKLIINLPKKDIGGSTFKKSKRYLFNIKDDISNMMEDINFSNITTDHIPENLIDKQSNRKKKFRSIKPEIFAQNLALTEMYLLKKIKSHEFYSWLKEDKAKRKFSAPNLYKMISFVNHISSWVSTEIVMEPDHVTRVSLIKKFILTAQFCVKYKNYQGLLEIIYGLSNTGVQRLKAWKKLDSKYLVLYTKLQTIVSPNNNWNNYRELIEKESEPCVPYVGLILSDLTFLNDGIPGKLEDGHINWKKVTKIYNVLNKVKALQERIYSLPINTTVIRFITEETGKIDDRQLYLLSRNIEPNTRRRSQSLTN